MQAQDFMGKWRNEETGSVIEIRESSNLDLEGRMVEVSAADEAHNFEVGDLVWKEFNVGHPVMFKKLIRVEDPTYEDSCIGTFVVSTGTVSQDKKTMVVTTRQGDFLFMKEAGKVVDCRYVESNSWSGAKKVVYRRQPSDENVKFKVNIPQSEQVDELAIGDRFFIEVEVTGGYSGPRLTVDLFLGDYRVKVPVDLRDPETEKPTTAVPENEEGPHYYQSEPVDMVLNEEAESFGSVTAEIKGQSVKVGVGGIRRLQVLELIDELVGGAAKAPNLVACIVEMARLSFLLESFDEPGFIEYAITTIVAAIGKSKNGEIMRLFLAELNTLSESALNRQLRGLVEKAAEVMINKDSWKRKQHVRQAFALLKRVAITNLLSHLTELNRLKKGTGKISEDSYLTHDLARAVTKLGEMSDEDDVRKFIETNGIAYGDKRVDKLYDQAGRYAKANANGLRRVWKEMEKHRKDYEWAMNQTDLVFDWSSTRGKYAKRYMDAEARYKGILGKHHLLAVIIEDEDGNDVPAWQALLAATYREKERKAVAAAVSAAESHIRKMLFKLAEMRDEEDLVELGSPRYKNLHDMVSSLQASWAKSLVELAVSQYNEVKSGNVVTGKLIDIGTWIGYGVGVFFPPVALASAAIDVGRSGKDTALAYRDASSAEASANVDFTSVLEADKASSHLKGTLGQLALDVLLGYVDVKAVNALRANRIYKGTKFNSVKAMKTREGIKKIAEQDAKYFAKLREHRRLAEKHRRIGLEREADFKEAERKLKELKPGPTYEKKRARLMEKRAHAKKQMIKRKNWSAKQLKNIDELRKKRLYKGRNKNYHMEEGKHVQDRIDQRLDNVFDLEMSGRTGNPFYSQMYKLGEGHYMFGPRTGKYMDNLPGKRPKRIPKLQYEIVTNKTIRTPDGKVVKPPGQIWVPGEGVLDYKSSHGSMVFDRIVIDHKSKFIYVEDIVRSHNKGHKMKTWAYAHAVEKMYPGYKATKVPLRNGLTWPRDIIYSEMDNLVVNLKPDLDKFPMLKGKKVQ